MFRPGGGAEQVLAHRYSYELHHGAIPEGAVVMHACDNRRCVNPLHLRLGTRADSSADMVAKGRSLRGERNHRAKVDERAVLAMHEMRSAGHTHQAIADAFGLARSTVTRTLGGTRWSHLAPPPCRGFCHARVLSGGPL